MSYQATNGDNGGGISKAVFGLGKAIGVIGTVYLTPLIFNALKADLYSRLIHAWGQDLAGIVIWVVAIAIAYAVYALIALVFAMVATYAMASFAASRFGG